MRCPTSSQTTSDLGSQEIGKSKENLKTALNYSLVSSAPYLLPPQKKEMKVLSILVEK